VGDTITVIATPSDGQTYGEAQYAETTVANTPPVVTSILVEEGYQAFEDGIYYFLVGQRAAIHVLVSDDDMDVNQGNDELRLQIGGELPPAVDGWYISEYRDGEFFLEATLADHGDPYEATKYYTISFCAVDRFDEGDPPLHVAVTAPRLRMAWVDALGGIAGGSGASGDPWIITSGTTATFQLTLFGVGFTPGVLPHPAPVPLVGGGPAIQTVFYSLYDYDWGPNPDDLLIEDATTTIRFFATASVDWKADGTFTLTANADRTISGSHGHTGASWEGDRKELYFSIWWWLAPPGNFEEVS
ncbi:MAG: hypothetical protein RMJ19_14045, partial [Gemmatales bacterium]|nr:hypothetical protein [Gemmatales bacterium]MDW8176794.1 hypothetical protein [Gemmatales bacterium]